jgi:hypothetical protein
VAVICGIASFSFVNNQKERLTVTLSVIGITIGIVAAAVMWFFAEGALIGP